MHLPNRITSYEKEEMTETVKQVSKIIVGQCIYCRMVATAEDSLSDEHILPFGIYGKQVLGKASCRNCAAITSAFEGKFMQDLAGVRRVMGFPTRHKNRKKDLKLQIEIVTTNDEVKTMEVTPDEFYPMIALPAFVPPAYITKDRYEGGIEMTGQETGEIRSPNAEHLFGQDVIDTHIEVRNLDSQTGGQAAGDLAQEPS